ncbi:NAD(+)--rifampin ADP-ribosyltransferase [Flaviaesturariibacter terrae]
MEFSPSNPIVRLCIQGMDREANGQPDDALALFLQAWREASSELEKYLAAFYVARRQEAPAERLAWLQTALEAARKAAPETVVGAEARLHAELADCYRALGEDAKAAEAAALSASLRTEMRDHGPFYHGTRADLQPGDLLTAGNRSNYQDDLQMNHIYFTALPNGAGLAAALARGDGRERVYLVEPTGPFENDPNVTDNKFPGNPTRSYRSDAPLRITGELADWHRISPAELQQWRDRLAGNKGKIIN